MALVFGPWHPTVALLAPQKTLYGTNTQNTTIEVSPDAAVELTLKSQGVKDKISFVSFFRDE